VRFRIGRNKEERNLVICTCICIVITLLVLGFLHSRNTWKEDVDRDGVKETIKEIHLPTGGRLRYVIEEDGIMYKTEYNPQGQIIHKWKMVPDPDREGLYIIYVWDGETEQWLLDQNQNGIPDKLEETNNSDNTQSNFSSDSGGTT